MDFGKCAEIIIKVAITAQTDALRHPWFQNAPPDIVDWLKQIKESYQFGTAIRHAKSEISQNEFQEYVIDNLPPRCPGLDDGRF